MYDKSPRKFRPNPNLKLMDQVRQVLRYYHYALRTEQTYCSWILQYIRFHGTSIHPKEMGSSHIEMFLSHLATDRKVTAATQKQALNAIVFLYKKVLDIPLEDGIAPVRARKKIRPPVVMTQKEVMEVLAYIQGTHLLMARLLYGCGLRLMECVRLRIQDIDLSRNKLYIREAKGGKERVSILPGALQKELENHVKRVEELHREDLEEGYGEVYIPEALARKYPGASKDFRWQYVFPSKKRSRDPRSGVVRRHHVLESGLQKAVKKAVNRAGIYKRITCHTFRHSFATHMLEKGVNIRVLQELMGHSDVKTTEIYTHVMNKDISSLVSPLDDLS